MEKTAAGVEASTVNTQPLLVALRKGLSWLDRAHQAWLDDRPVKTTQDDFLRILDQCDRLERTLRFLGCRECVRNEGACAPDGVFTCAACCGQLPPEPEGGWWKRWEPALAESILPELYPGPALEGADLGLQQPEQAASQGTLFDRGPVREEPRKKGRRR